MADIKYSGTTNVFASGFQNAIEALEIAKIETEFSYSEEENCVTFRTLIGNPITLNGNPIEIKFNHHQQPEKIDQPEVEVPEYNHGHPYEAWGIPYQRIVEGPSSTVYGDNLFSAKLYFDENNYLKIDSVFWAPQELYSGLYRGTSKNSVIEINAVENKDIEYRTFMNEIKHRDDLEKLVDCLKQLAHKNRIDLPSWDPKPVQNIDGYCIDSECPLISWLMYPMIREADSFCIAKNFHTFSPVLEEYGRLKYKDIVKKAFGISSSKLLKELWKFIDLGDDDVEMSYIKPVPCGPVGENAMPEEVSIARIKGTRTLSSLRFFTALGVYKAFGIDYLYQFFETCESSALEAAKSLVAYRSDSHYITNNLIFLSNYFDKAKVIKMFPIEVSRDYLQDTVRMIGELVSPNFIPESLQDRFGTTYKVPTKVKTLKELHDKLSADITTIKTEKNNRPIPLGDAEKSLNMDIGDDMKIIVASETKQLAIWGATLKHCIASYDRSAIEGETILAGVYRKNELLYNIRLSGLKSSLWEKAEPFEIESEESVIENNDPPNIRTANHLNRRIGHSSPIKELRGERNKPASKEDEDKIVQAIYSWYYKVKKEGLLEEPDKDEIL